MTTRPPIVPPLENGDHLTRVEFERRYHAMPDLKKAELIEGVVYTPSPVKFAGHGEEHAHLIAWLAVYAASTPKTRCGDNASVQLDNDNEPQPDVQLLIERDAGGQADLTVDGYVSGAPELVCEVASSSVSIDRNVKFRVYQRGGVKEYILWRVNDAVLEWFVLRDGKYEPLAPEGRILKSVTFPGLWLDPAALIAGDLSAVLAALARGLATSEHAAFVAKLAGR